MNQTISFDAALWDLKKVINRYSYLIKQYSLGAMLLLIVLIDSFFILSNDDFSYKILGAISLLYLGFQYKEYRAMKRKEARGEAIFLGNKKNERIAYLYSFLLFLFFAYLLSSSFFWLSVLRAIALHKLLKYLFYTPSISFFADGYHLIIIQGFHRKQIDFTYPTKLRFAYNLISFENSINGKVQWKDTNLDKARIESLKYFLAKNFGQEMVISPSTGQPLK